MDCPECDGDMWLGYVAPNGRTCPRGYMAMLGNEEQATVDRTGCLRCDDGHCITGGYGTYDPVLPCKGEQAVIAAQLAACATGTCTTEDNCWVRDIHTTPARPRCGAAPVRATAANTHAAEEYLALRGVG